MFDEIDPATLSAASCQQQQQPRQQQQQQQHPQQLQQQHQHQQRQRQWQQQQMWQQQHVCWRRQRKRGITECLDCPMSNELVADIGSGKQHPSRAAKYARLMVQAGVDNEAMHTLAKASGTNAERTLHNGFKASYPVQLSFIPLTLHNRITEQPEIQMVATIAPYELFAALHSAPGSFVCTPTPQNLALCSCCLEKLQGVVAS